jgi:hypothetical protein
MFFRRIRGMGQRTYWSALVLAGTASSLIGCGKADSPPQTEANPAPNAAVQMNISGSLPVVLDSDNIQTEIDKAGAGVRLVKLDLNSAGLPLTLDAPEGAKAQVDFGDVEVNAGDHFALRIRRGKRSFDQKRRELAEQKVLVNDKDLIVAVSLLLLEERYEFVRHVIVGLQDYSIENVDPLFGRQVHHSQADCLLMLKCIGTLASKTRPSDVAERSGRIGKQ